MPEIIAKVYGSEAVTKRLGEIASRMSNLSPVLKAIGDRIAEQTKRRFEAGGPDPAGDPWAALKPATLKYKKRDKILTESGQLKNSIRYQMIGNNTVNIGTNKIYAAVHQFGFKKRNIPARPYLGLSEKNSAEIVGIINDFIMEK
jgi:phage virion morphogenesis protein